MRARPAASAAISAMRMYWGTAALLTATVALCLAVLLPVTTLLGTPDDPFDNRLRISTVRGTASAFPGFPTSRLLPKLNGRRQRFFSGCSPAWRSQCLGPPRLQW